MWLQGCNRAAAQSRAILYRLRVLLPSSPHIHIPPCCNPPSNLMSTEIISLQLECGHLWRQHETAASPPQPVPRHCRREAGREDAASKWISRENLLRQDAIIHLEVFHDRDQASSLYRDPITQSPLLLQQGYWHESGWLGSNPSTFMIMFKDSNK